MEDAQWTTSKVRPELKGPPSQKCIDWVMSQPAETVIAQLRARPALWDVLCEQIGDNVREGCAVMADEYFSPATWRYATDQPYTIGREIAAAIRARGTDEPTQD